MDDYYANISKLWFWLGLFLSGGRGGSWLSIELKLSAASSLH